jgi:peroxiredoxin
MKLLYSIFTFLLLGHSVLAQGGYQLGQKVGNFTLKDAAGRQVSLQDFAGNKTVVLVFTNNLCPYSKLYENRLLSLNNTYQNRGVRFIFINPAIGAEDG